MTRRELAQRVLETSTPGSPAHELARLELQPGKRGRPPHPQREAAVALAAEGVPLAEIVQRTGASRRSICRWVKREAGR